MFDSDQKVWLVLGVALAGLMTLATDYYSPRENIDLQINAAALPPAPSSLGPGGAPRQTEVLNRYVALAGGFEAELLYGYMLEGVVVTRQEYRSDATSSVSPLDLGIVWGDLADRTDEFEFRNGRRAVFYRPLAGAALPEDWEVHITNNHLIPATPEVHAALMAIEPGQRIQIRGHLVEVTSDNIHPWRSSTRRDDATIVGGCEIILVSHVTQVFEDTDIVAENL